MKKLLAVLLLFRATALFGADDESALLKEITKEAAGGNQEVLAALSGLHGEKAGKCVLDLVTSSRAGGGIKARLAEVVAAWPADAAGRKILLDWLAKHPGCDDEVLHFFANARMSEARAFFWALLGQAQGAPDKLKQPQRHAMAALALGFFEDNPEHVVMRVGSLLAAEYPHVIRACAADALGGMRHVRAVEALAPHVEDAAVGRRVARSLFRLTGQHFEQDAAMRWKDWLSACGGRIDFKMHPAVEFENFLKLQALVRPADEAAADMHTFYGVDVRGNGLLFILDVSGSMTTDGRIETLRAQMGSILTALESRPAQTRFGILTFGENIAMCFPRGVMSNDEDSRRRAARFNERLKAGGGTPMVAALTQVLGKVLPDANIDTLFFLSDGQPNDGTPEMVLDLARRIHQRHRARIHTISIGEEAPAEFGARSLLEQMAEITGGSFTRPK